MKVVKPAKDEDEEPPLEFEDEEEKDKPVTQTKQAPKGTTVKKEKGVSNKSIVWGFFVKESITTKEQVTESFVESVAAQVPDVQKTTVKGWMRAWVDGKNMPACAKSR